MKFGVRHAAVVALAAAAWVAATNWDPIAHQHLTDLPVYEGMADRIAAGDVPYRDFDAEYPPAAVALFWCARVLPLTYAGAFSLLMFVALLATALGVMVAAQHLGLSARREVVAGSAVALVPVLLGDFVATRFDLALTALLAWVVAAAVARRFTWAWVLLGLAVLLKLIPLLLVPALVIWQRHTGRGRLTRDVSVAGAIVVAGVLPFVIADAAGLWAMLDYHLSRPLQIESMGGSYLLGIAALTDRPLEVATSFGSQNILGAGAGAVSAISSGLQLVLTAVVALVLVRALRSADAAQAPRLFVAAVAATMAATLATGKVLSPQFVLWLLPACLLITGRYGRHALVATVGIMLVTQLYFPYRYWDLVDQADRPIALLVIRNLLVIVLLAACWPRRPARRPARVPDAPTRDASAPRPA